MRDLQHYLYYPDWSHRWLQASVAFEFYVWPWVIGIDLADYLDDRGYNQASLHLGPLAIRLRWNFDR